MIWICVDRENDSLCEYTENKKIYIMSCGLDKIVLLFYKIKNCLYELLNVTLWLMMIDTLLFGLESNRILV